MAHYVGEMRKLRREVVTAYEAGDYKKAVFFNSQLLQMHLEHEKSSTMEYAMDVHNMGILFDSVGMNERAMHYYKEAAVLKKDCMGEGLSFADTLNNLAIAYSKQKDYEKALKFHQQVLRIRDMKLGKGHMDYVYSLYNLGNTYADLDDYEKAMELHHKALEKAGYIADFPQEDLADILLALGNAADLCGNYKKAISSYERALELMEKENAASFYQIQQIDDLAELCLRGGWLSLAIEYAEEAVGMREETKHTGQMDYLGSLSRLAAFYEKGEQYLQALEVYRKMLPYIRNLLGEKHFFYAEVLNSMGADYGEIGQYQKGFQYILEALQGKAESVGKKSLSYAVSLFSLGNLYEKTGKKGEALQQYQRILAYHKNGAERREERVLCADALQAIANILFRHGAYETAAEYERESLQIYLEEKGEYSEDYLQGLYTMAWQRQKNGEEAAALLLCKEARNILLSHAGESHPRYAWGLTQYSKILADGKKYNDAVAVLEEAEKVQKETLGEDNPIYLETLEELGKICVQGGAYEKAISYYLQKNDANFEETKEEQKEAAETLLAVAICYMNMQEAPKAEAYFQEAEEKMRRSGMEEDVLYQERKKEYTRLQAGIPVEASNQGKKAEQRKQLKEAVEIFKSLLEQRKQTEEMEAEEMEQGETIRNIVALGDLYLGLGKENDALFWYEKAEEYAEGKQYVTLCRKIGEVLLRKGGHEEALRRFHHAKSYMEEYGDVHTETYCMVIGRMGDCFYDMGNKEKALLFYLPHIQLFRALGLPKDTSYGERIERTAQMLARTGRHKEAAEYYSELARHRKEGEGETKEFSRLLLKTAVSHIAEGNREEAETLLDRVLLLAAQSGTDTMEYGKLCDRAGRLYAANGNTEKALDFLSFAYERTRQGEKCMTKEGIRNLLQILREKGDTKGYFAVKEGEKLE